MICRVCLKEPDCALNIFDANGEQLGIAQILQCHFWFTPLPDDTLSTVICHICWVKVNDFHQFYKTVKAAHLVQSEPSSLLPKGTYLKDEEDFVEREAKPSLITADVHIKEEVEAVWQQVENVNDQTAVLFEPELETVLMDSIGEELEIIGKELQEEEQKKGNVEEEVNELETDKNSEAEEVEAETTTRRKTRKYNSRKRKSQKALSDNDDEEEEVEVTPKRKRVVQKMITPHDDEMVKKHIPMGCDLCTFVGENFIAMTEHFRRQHKQLKPYIMCCGRKLNKRFKMVQHAYKHENPDFFRCQQCQKSFSNGNTLRNHMIASHAPEEDLTHACDQCDKKFSRKYLLELHKPSHIPINERKFSCEKCPQSKPFASEHLLQIHISMRHKKAVNVCHVCAKEIRDKQSFEKHVRLHFEDSGPRVKCPEPNCDSWLKDEDNLRQHLRRHRDEGKIFACNECGKVCKNRRALTSHFSYAHTNEVFSCEECNKTFKKAITLKEHMAQHTGESLYKCPFCTRTFNSNANMHSHKKKMHPVEWDIWRKTKRGSSQKIISNRFGANGSQLNVDFTLSV